MIKIMKKIMGSPRSWRFYLMSPISIIMFFLYVFGCIIWLLVLVIYVIIGWNLIIQPLCFLSRNTLTIMLLRHCCNQNIFCLIFSFPLIISIGVIEVTTYLVLFPAIPLMIYYVHREQFLYDMSNLLSGYFPILFTCRKFIKVKTLS